MPPEFIDLSETAPDEWGLPPDPYLEARREAFFDSFASEPMPVKEYDRVTWLEFAILLGMLLASIVFDI